MLLLAFPALEGSVSCLGSGDWPLDPHEILLHPQDLEKLRVPAFGYVAIHRNSSSNNNSGGGGGTASTGRRTSGHRRPRSAIGRGKEAEKDNTRSARGEESGEPITFCRAIPDDSLAPGETRAPAWLLGAASVRPRQHLSVHRAPEVATGEGMSVLGAPAGSRQHSPSNFRVNLSFASEQRQLGERGKDTARSGYAASSNAHIKARSIARRVSGCMVGVRSLLAAEVLGETVVLRVVTISDTLAGDDAGSNTITDRDAVDADESPLQKNFLITSPSQVSFMGDDETGDCGSSPLPPRGGASSSLPLGAEQARHRRPSTGCGGEGREVWARRAPGLETALDELQDLVLLSVGGEGSGGSGSSSCWQDVLPAGIAVCGPSGVGKTLALDILTENLREAHGVHIIRHLGPQILAGVGRSSGGDGGGDVPGEKVASPLLGGPLGLSLAEARARAPSVIVLDELDALFDACGGGDEGGGADPLAEGVRANAALLELLDRASAMQGVTVLGATRRSPGGKGGAGWTELETGGGGGGGGGIADGAPLPSAFRKPGRFDRCVAVGPPTQAQRERILRVLLSPAEGAPGWELEPLEIAPAAGSPIDGAAARGGAEAELKGSRTSPVGSRGGRHLETPHAEARGGIEGARRSGRGSPESAEAGRRRGNENSVRGTGVTAAGTLAEWAKRLSSVTPGMVGGDLARLVRTARARSAQRRRTAEPFASPLPLNTLPLNTLSWQDAMGAVAVTVPRSLRGLDVASFGSSSGDGGGGGAPTWASVGGFSEAKRRLQRLVQWPWLHPEAFARMGVSAPAGALLYGPSGCGKSLVAQVLATECLANFLWVRSSELLSR